MVVIVASCDESLLRQHWYLLLTAGNKCILRMAAARQLDDDLNLCSPWSHGSAGTHATGTGRISCVDCDPVLAVIQIESCSVVSRPLPGARQGPSALGPARFPVPNGPVGERQCVHLDGGVQLLVAEVRDHPLSQTGRAPPL